MFRHFELRALEIDRAVRFYETVLERPCRFEVSVLPERARQLGAPPNWQGQLGTADLEGLRAKWVAAGATVLGPERVNRDRTIVAGLRDPFGAALALTNRPASSERMGWHQHHSTDPARAAEFYATHFELELGERVEVPGIGLVIAFTTPTERGVFVSSSRLPHVHAQWLFGHHVEEVEEARRRVLANEGRALPVFRVSGLALAVCEDAEGAAFGLVG